MGKNSEVVTQSRGRNQSARWKRWILFYIGCVVIFVFGQAIEGMGLVSTKWLLIIPISLILYWRLFLKKASVEVEHTVKYEWGKKKSD
jgi:hypothetical protein